jgi:DNA-binding IclR family transcriptional regulator
MTFTAAETAGHVGAAEAPSGSPERPLRLTDPRMLRALAHPARIAILQHLGLDGPATATECAAVTHLSPSACSYHLRALASYGFVEPDPASAADGRHRPWRARVMAVDYKEEPGQPGAVRAAMRLLTESVQARISEIRAAYLDRAADYGPDWQAALGMRQDVLHVTAAELAALRTQVQDLLATYRRLDEASRPPGARRVHATLELMPWFEPESGR